MNCGCQGFFQDFDVEYRFFGGILSGAKVSIKASKPDR
jgi:hypothetical protein